MLRFVFLGSLALAILLPASVQAVSLTEVIRKCNADSKTYCKGVGYGQPMQNCLAKNRAKLTPACKGIVDRIGKGEKVRLFGG
jgi:hypothetical protein